jgi:hypothetical protein
MKIRRLLRISVNKAVGNEEVWPTKGLSDKDGDSEVKGSVKGFSFRRILEVMNGLLVLRTSGKERRQ